MKKSKFLKKCILTAMSAILALGVALPALATQTQAADATPITTLDAKSGFAVDAKTGKVLFDQNGDEPLAIASMTKLITIYLTLEAIKDKKLTWDQKLTPDALEAKLSVDPALSNVPLSTDKTYTVKEIYDSAVIFSANSSAMMLARAVAGSEAKAVDLMRKKVESWGIKDATLVNVSGLTNSDLGDAIYPGTAATDENKMSARSMAKVAYHLLKDFPEVLDTTKIVKEKFQEGTIDEVEMTSWNWMLPGLNFAYDDLKVDGLKTGTTDLAGPCFTGTVEKDGQRIITVVMHANDTANKGARFIETSKLMYAVFDNWEVQTYYKKGDYLKQMKEAKVSSGKEDTVKVALAKPVTLWVRKNTSKDDLKVAIKQKKKTVEAPVKAKTVLAVADIKLAGDDLGYLDGKKADTVDLIAVNSVEKKNIFALAIDGIGEFFKNLF